MNRNSHQRRGVNISAHARQRLKERFPEIEEKDYARICKKARYEGLLPTMPEVHPLISKFVSSHYHGNNSTQVRIYNNGVFIFCGVHGHARTLRTVVKIPQSILDKVNEVN